MSHVPVEKDMYRYIVSIFLHVCSHFLLTEDTVLVSALLLKKKSLFVVIICSS